MIDLSNIRKQFPILNDKIQLSSCSQSALHINVKNSVEKYIQTWEVDGMDWDLWMDVCEKSRAKFAQMINADPSEIAIVSSVSHAISSVLVSLNVPSNKNEAILSKSDFPCIGHATLSQNNYDVKFIESSLNNYLNNISDKTIIVSAPMVSFYNGELLDIKSIAEAAHQKGSYIFVDAYQAAGQVDIDVKELDIDFLATGMQKYMLGMPGVAFLYIKNEVAETIFPKITGWFGQLNPFAFDGEEILYAHGAKRFDTGTYSMVHGFASLSALEILLDIGVSNIEKYLRELSAFALDYSAEKGLEIVSPLNPKKKGSNTAIRVENTADIEYKLKTKDIIVSARNDVIRIAPHFYNTEDDVRLAIDELVNTIKA